MLIYVHDMKFLRSNLWLGVLSTDPTTETDSNTWAKFEGSKFNHVVKRAT